MFDAAISDDVNGRRMSLGVMFEHRCNAGVIACLGTVWRGHAHETCSSLHRLSTLAGEGMKLNRLRAEIAFVPFRISEAGEVEMNLGVVRFSCHLLVAWRQFYCTSYYIAVLSSMPC